MRGVDPKPPYSATTGLTRVPIPVISASLQARFRSRQDGPFGVKLLAAMRNQFGGHAVKKA